MSTTATTTETQIQGSQTGTVDFKREVALVPVSDADRAKQFYASLGWREDADFVLADDLRILQFTPPGSEASIIFGTGVTAAAAAPAGNLLLAVDDIAAARAELIERGVDVSEVFHGVGFDASGRRRVPGADPERKSYGSFASFSDPDGNEFLLQEVTERLPGRVTRNVAAESDLLLETALHHDAYEKVAPKHNWWDWYGAYMDARRAGSDPDEASAAAGRYMADVKHIVV
jgi:catechol 2,3-dioxygenase-like lactoylglutathione lyase family enzyme